MKNKIKAFIKTVPQVQVLIGNMLSTENTFTNSFKSFTGCKTAGPYIDLLWDDFVEEESELTS